MRQKSRQDFSCGIVETLETVVTWGGERGAGVKSKGSYLGFRFITGMKGISGLMTLYCELRLDLKTSGFGQLEKK